MIGKITGGGSFCGALDYLTKPKEPKRADEKEQYRERLREAHHAPGEPAPLFEAGERHRVIGGNMSGRTKGELKAEFEAVSRQRPDIRKPVHHASLSAGGRDRISVEQWNEIAARYVGEMGFKDSPYVVIQHRDGKTDHVHILTSRVDLNGRVVSDWRSKERAEVVLRGIERDYGLERVTPSREVERAAPKRGEIERFNRTGELSAKMSLQAHVELALKDGPTAAEFIERLQLSGVEAIPYVGKSGRATGISFRKGKELMKGSDLGRGFSWNALQERGLDYDPERDRPAVEAARQRATLSREIPEPTQPEYSFVDLAKDVGRDVGQYLLNQANPLRQIEAQVRTVEQVGWGIADGIAALRDVVARQGQAEQIGRGAGPEASGRDSIEHLQQVISVEPAKDGRDGLERLDAITTQGRKDSPADLTDTLERTTPAAPELSPTLEHEIEERAVEPILELLL